MKVDAKQLSALSVYKRLQKGEIDLAPEYQRGSVWSRRRQSLLIDSMLRGYDLPKFFIREVDGGPSEVVDGQQRLNAIVAFLANELKLPRESGVHLAGRSYASVPIDVSDAIDDYQLSFSVIRDADDEAIREMFLRLQMGVRLNAAEELNAVAGGMHDFVQALAEKAFFSERVAFSSNRGAHRHVASQLARLAVEGFGDVRKSDLLTLYRTRAAWAPDDNAKRLRQVIDWLGGVFSTRDPVLRNRGQVVSVAYGIYSLWTDLVFAGSEQAVLHAMRMLDQKHLGDDAAYGDFRLALAHSSDQKRSLETRHRYVLGGLAEFAPDIPRRDPKRIFSPEERAAMYYRDGGRCQHSGCGLVVDFASFHADHVEAWAKGGATTLANAQVLCPTHNLAKGAR
ncbi:MAG TPA: DUF262 domain-containing protein [Actinomycetota bacterium]|nr:DUF262 domain-containing protein [Actinomycetota bacterium]